MSAIHCWRPRCAASSASARWLKSPARRASSSWPTHGDARRVVAARQRGGALPQHAQPPRQPVRDQRRDDQHRDEHADADHADAARLLFRGNGFQRLHHTQPRDVAEITHQAVVHADRQFHRGFGVLLIAAGIEDQHLDRRRRTASRASRWSAAAMARCRPGRPMAPDPDRSARRVAPDAPVRPRFRSAAPGLLVVTAGSGPSHPPTEYFAQQCLPARAVGGGQAPVASASREQHRPASQSSVSQLQPPCLR